MEAERQKEREMEAQTEAAVKKDVSSLNYGTKIPSYSVIRPP